MASPIGKLYQEKMALLSPHGAELLRHSQRSWLSFIDLVCARGREANKNYRTTPEQCLQNEYNKRIHELADVDKLGPFLFNRVDLFSAVKADDESGATPGFIVQQVSYPQIDNLRSPAIDEWNQRMARTLIDPGSELEKGCDGSLSYRIGYRNEKLISVSWTNSFYCHGTPHGNWSIRNDNYVSSSSLRKLTDADVFGVDGPWKEQIGKMLLDGLRAEEWSPTQGQEQKIESDIRNIASAVDRWYFTKDGIEFNFSAYEGGCYICTPPTATIKWADLKPLLAPNALVP